MKGWTYQILWRWLSPNWGWSQVQTRGPFEALTTFAVRPIFPEIRASQPYYYAQEYWWNGTEWQLIYDERNW